MPGKTLNIAHRGASALFPENTLPAFQAAVDQGADLIELDVQFSKDRVPVVFHDAKLDSHSNGTGEVKNHTVQELKKLDAGAWHDASFAGEQIPLLEEVLAFAQNTIALNIEIKTEAVGNQIEHGIEQKCLQLVKKYDMQSHVLFSSFDSRALLHLKKLSPRQPAAILYSKRRDWSDMPAQIVQQYKADAFNCTYWQLTKKRFENLRTNDIPVLVYTVDDPQRMNKLIDMGVDGIFTNKPDLLNNVLNESELK